MRRSFQRARVGFLVGLLFLIPAVCLGQFPQDNGNMV